MIIPSLLRSSARALVPLLLATGAAATATPAAAQGDLLVAPTRVVLEGRRGAEVILSNIGSEEATYRIALELRRMQADGTLVPVGGDDANERERAALEMIRYAPRRITLPPGQPQSVRIGARPGADLPDGEYRVHMAFRAIPKPTAIAPSTAPATGIKIRLIPVYGVTIPVIVRHGRLSSDVTLRSPTIVEGPNGPTLQVDLVRSGGSSVYGQVVVRRAEGDEPIVAINGVAVYSELGERTAKVPLSPDQLAALKGPLRIEYREMPAAGGGLIAAIDTAL